jgi:hypothetical protein
MTDASAGDRGAVGLDGDGFLTVEQFAELRRVTPAAVRAQLRAGNLSGEQVLQGQRTVWRIPVSAARRYLERSGGSAGAASDDPAELSPGRSSAVRPSEVEKVPRVHRAGPSTAPAPSRGDVEALEAEVRRLRRQLSALAGAHRRLLDAVTAELPEDR